MKRYVVTVTESPGGRRSDPGDCRGPFSEILCARREKISASAQILSSLSQFRMNSGLFGTHSDHLKRTQVSLEVTQVAVLLFRGI